MAETAMERGVVQHSCGDQQLDPSGVGKTPKTTSSCNHQECDDFREESWCRRFFAIDLGGHDVMGDSFDCCPVGTYIKASLGTRSYRDCLVVEKDPVWYDAEHVLVVFLAEGEPPLTKDEVKSWNDYAATVCPREDTCPLTLSTYSCCCLFEAEKALSGLLRLCSSRSNQPLLHELMGEVRSALSLAYGENNVEQQRQQYEKQEKELAWMEWDKWANESEHKRVTVTRSACSA